MEKQDISKIQQSSGSIGKPGLMAEYHHEREDGLPGSVVRNLILILGSVEEREETEYQWFCLHGTKANGEAFSIWLLSSGYPPQTRALASKATVRYILQERDSEPLEFRDRFTGKAVLPVLGGWEYLMPRAAKYMPQDVLFPKEVRFFTEIETCIRLGVAYDLVWDLEGIDVSGYREVVRIREDGKVQVIAEGKEMLLEAARIPVRPSGKPPQLGVELSTSAGKAPLEVTGCATIIKGSAPVYYAIGANNQGIYENSMVCWELFGPGEEDYRFLNWEGLKPCVTEGDSVSTVEVDFSIDAVGSYRLRAATVDMAGRTTVVWKPVSIGDWPNVSEA